MITIKIPASTCTAPQSEVLHAVYRRVLRPDVATTEDDEHFSRTRNSITS